MVSGELAPPSITRDTLDRMVDLAKQAGAAIMAHYHSGTRAERKADDSPITAADREAHQVIVQALEAWYPEVPVVSEEGTIPGPGERAGWTRFWLVDPLDGTKEFLQRNGEFTVNIALIEGGEPVLGVVHAPAIGRTWFGGRGLGAWRVEGAAPPERIYSSAPEPGRPLTVVESRSHPSAELEEYLAGLNVGRRVQAGSSLKFCLVAEGQADLYPRLGPTMEWDVAAGDCVFRNSGAEAPRRSSLQYNTPELRNSGFVIGLEQEDS